MPELLGKLPWFRDLTADHRREMVEQIDARMTIETSREHYAALLESWAEVAHVDQKWARYELLRESGLLSVE
ncbi:MAG: hypothetical protein EXR66_02675 [Dehalococcoidia bacterium]|nr:hypothetical protein [Dehalococcoidia bacterium]